LAKIYQSALLIFDKLEGGNLQTFYVDENIMQKLSAFCLESAGKIERIIST